MSAQNGLLEFVSVLQSNDVGVVFETRAGCAFAVHIVASGAGGVVAGVVNVDVAVSGIQDVVFADMVFRAEREPDAVAVGQGVQAVGCVADGALVERHAAAQLQLVVILVRRAQADFERVAPIGVSTVRLEVRRAELFGVLEQQFGAVEAAVARPSNITKQV